MEPNPGEYNRLFEEVYAIVDQTWQEPETNSGNNALKPPTLAEEILTSVDQLCSRAFSRYYSLLLTTYGAGSLATIWYAREGVALNSEFYGPYTIQALAGAGIVALAAGLLPHLPKVLDMARGTGRILQRFWNSPGTSFSS